MRDLSNLLCDYPWEEKRLMKNADIAGKITTEAIAAAPQGSWKWQNAYRATDYRAKLADNGKVLWRACACTVKMSMPQIRRNGYGHLPIGGLHNHTRYPGKQRSNR